MTHPLLITGCHRSGTSMTAQLLGEAGLHLGEKLLEGNASNPHGHFEDVEVVRFHERLLEGRGLSWQVTRPFLARLSNRDWRWLNGYTARRAASPCWGFKDPRLCLFLPLWKRALPTAKILYVYRPPGETVISMKRRAANDLLHDKGGRENNLRFWQDLNTAARVYHCYARMFLTSARPYGADVAFVSRQALIDGFDLSRALRLLWGLDLEPCDIDAVYDPSVTNHDSATGFSTDDAMLALTADVVEEIEDRLLEAKL